MIRQAITQRLSALLSRRYHYRGCFLNEQGQTTPQGIAVLKDLARYCDAYRTTMKTGPSGIDPHASAVAEGRRQVWLRLQAMLRLPDEEILRSMENEP